MGTRASPGWLAGCLANFCQSHTHPGGHFFIHAWLDSTHRSHHQACPAAQTTHTHVSPAASVSLKTEHRGEQGLEHVQQEDRSYPAPTHMGGPKASVAGRLHPLELPPGGYPNPFSSDPGCSLSLFRFHLVFLNRLTV